MRQTHELSAQFQNMGKRQIANIDVFFPVKKKKKKEIGLYHTIRVTKLNLYKAY